MPARPTVNVLNMVKILRSEAVFVVVGTVMAAKSSGTMTWLMLFWGKLAASVEITQTAYGNRFCLRQKKTPESAGLSGVSILVSQNGLVQLFADLSNRLVNQGTLIFRREVL